MHRFNEQRKFIANITPNGVVILFAMALMGGANLLKKEIEFVSQMSDKTSNAAMEILSSEGYITHSRIDGWCLTEGGKQLALPFVQNFTASRRISDSISSINTESLLTLKLIDSNTNSESEILRLNELRAALTSAMIGEPMRSRLMLLPGLTRVHVERYAQVKKSELGESYRPGALVNALRSLPENPDLPNDPDDEAGNARRKYITGKFADFVNQGDDHEPQEE